MPLVFGLNGQVVRVADVPATTTVLDWLRETRSLTGTKEGCAEGDCGACTVVVASLEDGAVVHRPHNACILFLPQLHGRALRTVEGLKGPSGELHPVQRAMVEHHGSQCGFCTPGFVMSLYAEDARRRAAQLPRAFDDVVAGNLCRCTGYAPIARAAEEAWSEAPADWAKGDAELLSQMASSSPDAGADLELPGGYLPGTLDGFADWYVDHPEATVVAGATDVGLWVTKSLRELSQVAFLHRLKELQQIELTEDGMRIGAGVTLERLRSAVAAPYPDFAELLRRYGSVQVRAAATLGGNIANGSPIGDSPPALIALGATLTLRRGASRRELPLEDFFLDYGRQDRQPGELVESVFIPKSTHPLRCYKISKRFDQDISALLGCFHVATRDGLVESARVAFGGMAAIPKRAETAEAAMLRKPWTEETVRAAAAALGSDFAPISDMRASAAYRLHAAENLFMRYFVETTRPSVATRLVGSSAQESPEAP